MNDELQKQMAAWLEMLRNGTMDAAEFAKGQVPAVLEELIRYTTVMSALWVASASVALFFAIRVHRAAWNAERDKHYGWWKDVEVARALVSGTIGLAAIIGIIVNLVTLIKVVVAPRLFLMEYFMSILK